MGWQGWASATYGKTLGAIPTWAGFWAVNAALIVFGIACATVGWKAPGFSLGLAAESIINALFFHILFTVKDRRPNPGFFTACLLYVPIGIWAYVAASQDGVLSVGTVILSVAVGIAALALAFGSVVISGKIHYPDVS